MIASDCWRFVRISGKISFDRLVGSNETRALRIKRSETKEFPLDPRNHERLVQIEVPPRKEDGKVV